MIDEIDICYCVIFYCLDKGLLIENILNDYTLVKNENFEFTRWQMDVPQPDPYYLLEHTTQEQVEMAKKRYNNYTIEQQMKSDPLYPIVKNMMLPVMSGPTNEDLHKKLEKLEKMILDLTNKIDEKLT